MDILSVSFSYDLKRCLDLSSKMAEFLISQKFTNQSEMATYGGDGPKF